MIQKKVCMLGSFAVGKTSLTRRYVDNVFSDVYRTTLGVKIDKKVVGVGADEVTMVVWDVQGDDHEQRVVPAYLRGMAGYFLVVDPTRPQTTRTAIELRERVEHVAGSVPWVMVLNKADLRDTWVTEPALLSIVGASAAAVVETSAKTGSGVEACFDAMARTLLTPDPERVRP